MTTLPDPPRTPLVEPGSTMLARPWVLFFDQLRRAIVGGLDDAVGGRLDQLEADALFDTDSGGGGGSSYNDAPLRGRLDAIETDLLFPSPGPSEDPELAARVALLESDAEARELDAAVTPDLNGNLRRILQRLADLETDTLF